MTTYRVNYGDHKNCEYPEYTKFPRQLAPCGITWVALEVAPNRVKRFDLSQLTEVVDPRLTGMVYGCKEPPPHQHWLDVQQARIEWNWKHVFIPADMLGKFSAGWEGADTEKSIGIRLCPLWKPRTLITVFAESMRAA